MNKKITEIYNTMIQRTKFTDETSREMEKKLKELLSGLGKLLYREKNSGFCVSDLEKKQTEKQRA